MTYDFETGTETMYQDQRLEWSVNDGEVDLGFDDGTFLTTLNREQALNVVAGLCYLLNQMERK